MQVATQIPSLSSLLKCKSFGLFVNADGEHCTVSQYYLKNTKNIQVCFTDGKKVATRFAIRSTSDKRIAKLLVTEGFNLVD